MGTTFIALVNDPFRQCQSWDLLEEMLIEDQTEELQ